MMLDLSTPCALFFALREVTDVKNQTFKQKGKLDRAKKLDVILRQMTGDAITQEQRKHLQCALGHRRQYRLRLCATGCDFEQAVTLKHGKAGEGKHVKMLSGSNCGLLAALVSGQATKKGGNTVYLYLTKSKEASDDAVQKKDKEKA